MSDEPIRIDRRNFLATAAVVGVGAALSTHIPFSQIARNFPFHNPRLRGGSFDRAETYNSKLHFHQSNEYARTLAFDWDLANAKTRTVETATVIHVVETHPFERDISALSTKRTERISLVDWTHSREISSHSLPAGEYFYGHTIFSADGHTLIAATYNMAGPSGISVFEFPSLKRIDFIPTVNGHAHEVCLLEPGKIIYGEAEQKSGLISFAVLDLATRRIENYPTEFKELKKNFSMPHLKDCGDRYIANVNAWPNMLDSDEGAIVSFNKRTHEVKTEITLGSNGLVNEILSLDYDPLNQYAWITIPTESRIKVWNLKTDSLVTTLDFGKELPSSVSYFDALETTIVSTKQRFYAFNSKTLARIESFENKAPHQLLDERVCSHTRII